MEDSVALRFWPKVEKTDGCWNWIATLDRDGYGVIVVNGKMSRAHRVSYEMHFGAIPEGALVCHSCDNRRCVNPAHLQLGTMADNNRDRAKRNSYVGRPPKRKRRPGSVKERFWASVDTTGECWFWSGSKNAGGYGTFKIDLKVYRAHRTAYEFIHGPIPEGLCVLHSCDNPACVRPEHLSLGTRAENALDREAKKRGRPGHPSSGNFNACPPEARSLIMKKKAARGAAHGSKTHPEKWVRGADHWSHKFPEKRATGERHGSKTHPESVLARSGELSASAKLTAVQIEQLRAEYAQGGISQDALGARYGIGQTQVSRIIHRKRWAK